MQQTYLRQSVVVAAADLISGDVRCYSEKIGSCRAAACAFLLLQANGQAVVTVVVAAFRLIVASQVMVATNEKRQLLDCLACANPNQATK